MTIIVAYSSPYAPRPLVRHSTAVDAFIVYSLRSTGLRLAETFEAFVAAYALVDRTDVRPQGAERLMIIVEEQQQCSYKKKARY